jgi:hypothetical protein
MSSIHHFPPLYDFITPISYKYVTSDENVLSYLKKI